MGNGLSAHLGPSFIIFAIYGPTISLHYMYNILKTYLRVKLKLYVYSTCKILILHVKSVL